MSLESDFALASGAIIDFTFLRGKDAKSETKVHGEKKRTPSFLDAEKRVICQIVFAADDSVLRGTFYDLYEGCDP